MKIVQHPDPILKTPTVRVKPESNLFKLIVHMRHLLASVKGLGLSAQQAGSTQRVALVTLGGRVTACINLEIVERSRDSILSPREGCLSVVLAGRGEVFRMNVKRSKRVKIRYEDESRVVVERWVGGLEAIIAQHEVEHLDGKCIIDRLDARQLVKVGL